MRLTQTNSITYPGIKDRKADIQEAKMSFFQSDVTIESVNFQRQHLIAPC